MLTPTLGAAATTKYAITKLGSPTAHPSVFLGTATAMSGRTLVVGAPGTVTGPGGGQGAVYVYTRAAHGTWSEAPVAVLSNKASISTNDNFGDPPESYAGYGSSVAVSGSTIVVGGDGMLDVFSEPKSGWKTTSTPTASLAAADEDFYGGVAVSGSTIVATANNGTTYGTDAVVFKEPASGRWSAVAPVAVLTTEPPGVESLLPIGISGRLLVVGTANPGSVEAFVEPQTGWKSAGPTATLEDPGLAANYDGFGTSLAISGSTVLVGAPGRDISPHSAGAVYVFPAPAGGWTAATGTIVDSKKLTVSGNETDASLGSAMAANANQLVVTAPGYKPATKTTTGAAYVFTAPKSGWTHATETEQLPVPSLQKGADFGSSVGFTSAGIAVGAQYENYFRGATYLYTSK